MTANGESVEAVERFKQNLLDQPNNEAFTRQHILHGSCYAIDDKQHYRLKEVVAEQYRLETTTDIFIVGSAKLGFSIAPRKRYRNFGDRSDIDVAIVNHELYQRIWHEVHRYRGSGADWPSQEDFESYLSWGWIRPDKLPTARAFQFAREWWDFFRSLQQRRIAGAYKVTGALYHDVEFLIRYQSTAVMKCRTTGQEAKL